ncbi:MAG: aspartate carbamoyltransferase catalytic subunit [Proteobacteria bacterium]|nr:aspartate carbamoyltransferase catalytic subunit [Pseudomonadota bacterium]
MNTNNIQIDSQGKLRHLLKIDGLSRSHLTQILDIADQYIAYNQHKYSALDSLKNYTSVNLLFENSTRTRVSFELAAKRLGVEVINFDLSTSSIQKGETMLDTIHTLQAMHCNFFVIRHSENNIVEFIAQNVNHEVAVINAGDGTHAHPSQALLDMLTIRQHKKSFEHLKVAIVGDIRHSRVAHSAITALPILGCKDIRIIGPDFLLPESKITGVEMFRDMKKGLEDVDVIMMLRIQKERIKNTSLPDIQEYYENYGLTPKKLKLAKPDAIVMHPGPMNRGIEIDSSIADGPQSVILQQVSNGVAVRMAIFSVLAETLAL